MFNINLCLILVLCWGKILAAGLAEKGPINQSTDVIKVIPPSGEPIMVPCGSDGLLVPKIIEGLFKSLSEKPNIFIPEQLSLALGEQILTPEDKIESGSDLTLTTMGYGAYLRKFPEQIKLTIDQQFCHFCFPKGKRLNHLSPEDKIHAILAVLIAIQKARSEGSIIGIGEDNYIFDRKIRFSTENFGKISERSDGTIVRFLGFADEEYIIVKTFVRITGDLEYTHVQLVQLSNINKYKPLRLVYDLCVLDHRHSSNTLIPTTFRNVELFDKFGKKLFSFKKEIQTPHGSMELEMVDAHLIVCSVYPFKPIKSVKKEISDELGYPVELFLELFTSEGIKEVKVEDYSSMPFAAVLGKLIARKAEPEEPILETEEQIEVQQL